MAKGTSQSLYQLVHSLSGSERRYYKLTSQMGKSETPMLLKLFDAIDYQQAYDEPKLFKSLKKYFPNANIFRVQKVRLYDSILKTMRQYHASDKNVETQLAQDIQNIRFLVKKKLLIEAERYIRSSKKVAYRYERFFHLLALIRLENDVLFAKQDLRAIARQTDTQRREAVEVLELISAYFDIQNIDLHVQEIILTENFTRGERLSRIEKYQKLLQAKAFRPNVLKHLFEARIFHFILQNIYDEERESLTKGPVWERFRSRYEKFMLTIEKEGKSYLFKTHEDRFFSLLYGFLRYANNTTLPHATNALRLFEMAKFENENLTIRQRIISFRMALRFAYVQGDVRLFHHALSTYFPFLEKNESVIAQDQVITVYSSLLKCYLMFAKYKEAAKAAKKILSFAKKAPGIRVDIVDEAFLLLVLIYGETNQRTNFYRSIKPVEATIQNKQLVNSIDSEIIAYGKILVGNMGIIEKRVALEEHVKKIKEISVLKHNKILLTYFDFLSWYESKLDKYPGKKFIEMIRKNNGME